MNFAEAGSLSRWDLSLRLNRPKVRIGGLPQIWGIAILNISAKNVDLGRSCSTYHVEVIDSYTVGATRQEAVDMHTSAEFCKAFCEKMAASA
jgi:hypothetical protein